MKPAAVLFDLDGTLLDNSEHVVEAYHQGAAKLGYSVDKKTIAKLAGKSTRKTAKGMGLPEEHWKSIDDSFWEYFGRLVSDPETSVTVLEGVANLLTFLQDQGVVMGIVTSNSSGNARKLLERAGLATYFGCFIGKDSVEHLKPSPQPIIEALSKLGFSNWDHNSIWFVGDTASDVTAAQRAGVRAVAIPHEVSLLSVMQAAPDLIVDDLEQLKRYCNLVFGKGAIADPTTVIIDFDGTISMQDVAEVLLNQFAQGDWRKPEREAMEGKRTMDDVIRMQYSMLSGELGTWLELVRHEPIREGFGEFLRWCHETGLNVTCVSAGLSFVIDDFKRSQGWILPVVVPLSRPENGSVKVSTVPFDSQFLDFKDHQVKVRQANGHRVIYVGDGGSDFMGALHADHRFAVEGSSLSHHLSSQSLNYDAFQDFHELRGKIAALLQ